MKGKFAVKKREISTISFFLEPSDVPLKDYEMGYYRISGKWFKLQMTIDGVCPDCPAIDIKEFYRMLNAPGDYEPFTCTCGNSGCANIDYYVRCRHKGELMILFIRDPLRGCDPDREDDFDRKFRY